MEAFFVSVLFPLLLLGDLLNEFTDSASLYSYVMPLHYVNFPSFFP